jgi:3D (Asp-Asp-Asp) domain-containing protein
VKRIKTTAVLAAAAVALAPAVPTPVEAHHRDADRWERNHDHHHRRWTYRRDKRVTLHRRWHDWHTSRGGRTFERHHKPVALRVESTAYCLTGYMANGQRTHTGAAAMNGVPLGTKFRIRTGPLKGEVMVVKDRVGSGSDFDIAMPDRCSRAYRYGRRTINIRRVNS